MTRYTRRDTAGANEWEDTMPDHAIQEGTSYDCPCKDCKTWWATVNTNPTNWPATRDNTHKEETR